MLLIKMSGVSRLMIISIKRQTSGLCVCIKTSISKSNLFTKTDSKIYYFMLGPTLSWVTFLLQNKMIQPHPTALDQLIDSLKGIENY